MQSIYFTILPLLKVLRTKLDDYLFTLLKAEFTHL